MNGSEGASGEATGLDRAGHPFGRHAAADFDARRFEGGLRGLAARAPLRIPDADLPKAFRRSSVLLAFWPEGDDVAVLLTKRARTLRGHPGMMAFPGGQLDAGESFLEAALRETEEEVGIDRDAIEILGRLDDAWSGSGHRLAPFVGWLSARPEVCANPDEVDSIHTPRVSHLLHPDAWSRKRIDLDGHLHFDATLRWDEDHVYGLSADLLVEALLRGLALPSRNGETRLESLRAWRRMKTRPR